MNKGKFASLILLGAFSAGVASSSAVSAQGDINLASTVDISIGSHDDSVAIDSKVSNESAVAADEANIDAETTIDEETKNAITDENNDARDDTENLDENIEDETDLPKGPDKESSENGDYVFVADDKKQNVKKGKGVGMAEGLAVAGGASAVGIATLGISKLVKSSGDGKKDEPSPEPTPEPKPKPEPKPDPEPKPEPKPEPEPEPEPNKKEEKGGFVYRFWTLYKNNLGVSIPLTILFAYFIQIIVRMIIFEFQQWECKYGIFLNLANSKPSREREQNIKPFLGRWESFTNSDRFNKNKSNLLMEPDKYTAFYKGFKRLVVNFIAAATFAKYDWISADTFAGSKD